MPRVPNYLSDPLPGATPDHQAMTNLDWALTWVEQGWPVFPLNPRNKMPLFPSPHPKGTKCDGRCGLLGHGVLDATRDADKVREWWAKNPTAGIGGSTSGRLILDFDYNHGAQRNNATLPPSREHLSGRGNGNTHLVYRVSTPAGEALGQGKLATGIDIKAGPSAYVVLPPTLHEESRQPYTILDPSVPEHVITDDEIRAIWEAYGAKTPASVKGAAQGIVAMSGGKAPRKRVSLSGNPFAGQKLSELLADPPSRGTGDTNYWITAVAGHYAKMHRDKRDLYEIEVRRAITMVDPDYEDTDKTLESIWATEQVNVENSANDQNGYLVGTGHALLVQAMVGAGEDRRLGLVPLGDFDITATGVMVDEDFRRSYQVKLYAKGKEIETTLSPVTLADNKKLTLWLSHYAATANVPITVHPPMATTTRIQRYLESQHPPEVRVVHHLGWDPVTEQFVTFDGAIRETGPLSIRDSGVIVDHDKVERRAAKNHYGFDGSWKEAQEVLREVQSFHFPETAHLFGAWWAACLLKPQAMDYTSLFPFFGVEGVSGSGKTNGYFSLMVQLNGNYRGTVLPTTASFRDMAIANSNGIVWADDLNDPQRLEEILRASTSGGTVTKMDEDRKPKDFQVVAPLFFSGEALGFQAQKALMDRGVVINPKPPVGRMSQKPGRENRPQWDDITELQSRYKGEQRMTALAGWYVQEALRAQSAFIGVVKESRAASGRRGEKYAIFAAGARLLDHLMGEEGAWDGAGPTATYVDEWIEERATAERGLEDDSQLTTRLIPWAISVWGRMDPDKARLVDFRSSRSQIPPVLVRVVGEETAVEEVDVYVSVSTLARAWDESRMGKIDNRLETTGGLDRQIQEIAVPARSGGRLAKKVEGHSTQYRKLLPQYARLVLDRAEGLSP